MPKITLEKSTAKSAEETYKLIKDFLSDDPDLKKLDSSYKCQFDDTNLTGVAKGSKFTAKLNVENKGDNTNVVIMLDMSMFLTPFKSLVETTLDKKLGKLLA